MVNERFTQLYQERLQERRLKFTEIVGRSFDEDQPPIGINGYDHIQEKMITAALATAVCPEILELSHCAHRAVVACLAMDFDYFPEELLQLLSNEHPGNLTVVKPEQDSTRTILLSFGYNKWQEPLNPNLGYTERLNCKPIPGKPTEVPRETMFHLEDRSLEDTTQVDNACPKRTKNLSCNIIHAEADVIESTLDVLNDLRGLGIPKPSKTILASTWVSCPDCFDKIYKRQETYGDKIDLFCVYSTMDDPEENLMAVEIKRRLDKNHLGHQLGPHVKIPKEPAGYGWWVTKSDTIDKIVESLKTRRLIDASINRLLLRSFDLAIVINH